MFLLFISFIFVVEAFQIADFRQTTNYDRWKSNHSLQSIKRTKTVLDVEFHSKCDKILFHRKRTICRQAIDSENIKAQKKKSIGKKRGKVKFSSSGQDAEASANESSGLTTNEPGKSNSLVNDPNADIPPSSSKGMTRLSRAVAKASAERENESTKRSLNQKIHQSSNPNRPTDAPTSTFISNQSSGNTSPKSLAQLTRVIDSQLYANGPRGTTRGDYPKLDGVVQSARDNMISLLGFNQLKGDWKIHSSRSTYNVAIVFGKKLVRDQITVEYASRIRTLARLFKNDAEFRPSLVCFCGGKAEGGHVASADAGYIFFRNMCEAQDIDLEGVGIFIANKSQDDYEAIQLVVDEIKKEHVPKWLDASPETTSLKQKAINVHFTLVSTEYHLCNINDVHHRSPGQSLLRNIEMISDSYRDPPPNSNSMKSSIGPISSTLSSGMLRKGFENSDNDDCNTFDRDVTNTIRGLVKVSWSFQYATYPYIYAKNDSIVFLGKCFLLGEELLPLLINMKGVVEQKEFFQRDNYLMLASIRRSLVQEIEALHKPIHSRKKALNNALRNMKDSNGKERNGITILEGALLSLGRCVDLVKPAGLHLGIVSKEDWRRALQSLEYSMNEIQTFCDPDRPLSTSEWMKLVEDSK